MIDGEVEECLASEGLWRLLETAIVRQINLVYFDELEELVVLDKFQQH